ncbi:MAG: Verru_Chthon cassette protein A [Chthoniobacterales bacterium]
MESIKMHHPRHSPISRAEGMALIIVLASLIFLSALVLAFLAGVGTELKSSKSYADSLSARLLADSATNLVMAQIKTATAGGSSTSRLAWASQPGMIRTFDTNGDLVRAYKLYSSRDLFLTSVNAADEADALENWKDKPAHYTDLNAPVSGQYPILDPAAEGVIEGFSFSSLPAGVTKGEMPVEWLYILKNGAIVAPDAVGAATDTATVSGASKSNPIVGRIAFWSDDETAKVNVNTASEGTYWDTPRVVTQADRKLGEFQPVKNEFQRYPGHPAMTSFATALPTITSAAKAYAVSPRYDAGGSEEGKVSNVTAAMSPKKDRLYASIDELAFDPDRNPQGISEADLELSRFFLTASSRAPEVNIFNEPRVAMWPIHSNSGNTYRTLEDRLIAFCSTINGEPYYFQRTNAASPTSDYVNIARNRDLFGYLQRLTADEFPGFGGNFSGKYGADRDQILTEMFDYIRSTNLNDQGTTNPFAPSGQVTPIYIAASDTLGFGRFPTVAEAGVAFTYVANGKLTGETGATADPEKPLPGQTPAYAGTDGNGTPPDDTEVVQAYFVMSFMNPAMGYPSYTPSFTVEIEGLNQFTVNGSTIGFPATGSTYVNWSAWPATSMRGHEPPAGGLDPRWFVIGKNLTSTGANRFPFFSFPIELPTKKLGYNGTYFSFKGGTITVKIYAGDSTDAANLVQTLEIPITPTAINLPPPWKAKGTNANIFRLLGDRFKHCYGNSDNHLLGEADGRAQDTVVTAFFTSGDARTAFKRSVEDGLFSMTPYNSASPNMRSNFCANSGYSFFTGSKQGKLIKDTSSTLFSNILPAPINGVHVGGDSAMPVGDFDNGIASMPDGPYINKPDEGDLSGMGEVGESPYFKGWGKYSAVNSTYFSPNRQVPSSGMFGSLSTGIKVGKPWRTLLFRPDPSGDHFGGSGLPDHLFMDLFWMPVVEPYAISEPFSTAGKTNLNTQIMPFSFITRETALRAVMKAERLLAVPQSKVQNYKNLNNLSAPPDADFRFDLNLDETLKDLRQRFTSNDIYRSASEICEINLVPDSPGTTLANIETFWKNNLLTGDNSRERPYTNIYPRLTTKSNTFRVHIRVQTLQNRPSDPPNKWTEGHGQITSEYRGSVLVERYVDPNDTAIPDYATASNPAPLDRFYKFRVPLTKQFNP